MLKRVKRYQLIEPWDGPECREWMLLLPWRRDNRGELYSHLARSILNDKIVNLPQHTTPRNY
jgi:hypothetical protein